MSRYDIIIFLYRWKDFPERISELKPYSWKIKLDAREGVVPRFNKWFNKWQEMLHVPNLRTVDSLACFKAEVMQDM